MDVCTITCPSCGFSKKVPSEKIPQNSITIRCPFCNQRFQFQRTQAGREAEPIPSHEPTAVAPMSQQGTEKPRPQGLGSGKAAIFLILMIIMGLVAARFWLDSKARAVPFPYWLSASEHGVAVLYGDQFFVVDHQGVIQMSQELPAGTEPCQILWQKEAIWVSDFKNDCIHRYNDGWDESIQLDGPEIRAHLNVAVEPMSGDLYVADSQSSRVLVYDSQGKFLREFGQRGNADGDMNFPKDLFFDASGRLIVGNTRRPAVDLFKSDGAFVEKLIKPLARPFYYFLTDIAVGDQNIVTIECDELVSGCLIAEYDYDGRLLQKVEQTPGDQAPGDVAMWGGNVYVSDCRNRGVKVLSVDGLEEIGPLSAALDDIGKQWNEQASFYRSLSKGSLYAMAFCFASMFWVYIHSKRS